jgi:hypothetical protein
MFKLINGMENILKRDCIDCGEPIPEGRIKALPKVKKCVKCSDTDKYGVISINNDKTGNEIQIIKDRKLAEKINKASQREGYGVMNGVKPTEVE